MKLKLNEQGLAIAQDGKPVFVYDDGKEAAVDVPGLSAKYSTLSSQLDGLRERAAGAEERLKKLGASDEEISTALEIAKKVKQKELVDAGQVDEAVKERIAAHTKEAERKAAEYEAKIKERDASLDRLLISNRFGQTKVLEDYFLTPDLAEAAFSRYFKREGDQIIPYKRLPNGNGDQGERIFSRSKPSELADFDEAFKELLESHPNRDKWKKSPGATGSGAPGSNAARGGGKTIPRTEFFALPPAEQMRLSKEGYTLTE